MFLDSLVDRMHKSIFNYQHALDYLVSREVTVEDINKYKIGYSKVVTAPESTDPDVITFREKTSKGFKMQNKIIFPFRDMMGQVYGMGGRAIDKKMFDIYATDRAKYEGYMFGLYEALPYIYKTGKVIVVEGLFDLMAVQKVFPNSVAAVTSELSDSQYDVLTLFAETIIVMFDSDGPGQRGTESALKRKKTVSVSYGSYKDPASCIETLKFDKFKTYITKCVDAIIL
jgi:DNA primase